MIDVIVPTTKEESPYLKEAIRSAKGQGCDPEIILLHDHDRKGPSWVRNECIRYSKNSVVAFLDHDDICLSSRLASQAKAILDGADFCVCGASFIDGHGAPLPGKVTCKNFSLAKHLVRSQIASTSCLMFRRSVLQALGGFDEAIFANAEYDLVLRALKRFKGVYIEDVLVQVRRHGQNLSKDKALLRKGERQALMKVSVEEVKEILEDEIDVAKVLLRRGNGREAELVLAKLEGFEAWFLLGVMHFRRENYLRSSFCFERANKIKPDQPEVLNNLGVILGVISKPLEAKEYFLKALRLFPGYEDAEKGFTLTESLLR